MKLLLGKEKSALQFKLDTGAQVNVTPLQKFKQMKLKDIKFERTNTKLTGYGGTNLKMKGKFSYSAATKILKLLELSMLSTLTHLQFWVYKVVLIWA